ncbi:MAG TPA: nucleotide exchange factor GrpE [Gemmatimonadota bacterium]|nr:nucleotide exchange factor GrpE [Gemmatimonadota bacterium]
MSARDETREVPIEDPEAETPSAEDGERGDLSDDPAVATEDLEEEIGEELSALQDRFLRLQAEFDNYRKREARERSAAWARAKADLVQKLLGALDDLQRVAHFDPERTSAAAIFDGVSLVERKLSETLRREGLTRIGETGEPFDPHRHEAISTLPAPSPEQDGTVAAVAIPGYEFGSQLLRPAQVQVYEYRADRS